MTAFKRTIEVKDIETFRRDFVTEFINEIPSFSKLLDIGAGLMPYRQLCLNRSINYKSHDFSQYLADKEFPGFHDLNYEAPKYDLVCDILELPELMNDYFLLTEVLEHVPDPVSALRKALGTLRPGGIGLITVPLMSHIHQAPYFYCSGFSPYFFEFHSAHMNYEILNIFLVGDEVDYLVREVPKIVPFRGFWRIDFQHLTFLTLSKFSRIIRNRMETSIVSSGGFFTFAIIKKSI